MVWAQKDTGLLSIQGFLLGFFVLFFWDNWKRNKVRRRWVAQKVSHNATCRLCSLHKKTTWLYVCVNVNLWWLAEKLIFIKIQHSSVDPVSRCIGSETMAIYAHIFVEQNLLCCPRCWNTTEVKFWLLSMVLKSSRGDSVVLSMAAKPAQ